MDLSHMREFVDLSQSRNFTETSKRFHIAQSTLSKHISSMEKELGIPLFTRTTTSVRLTDQGKTFCEGCIASLSIYDAALEKSRETKHVINVGGNLFVPSIHDALFLANSHFEKQGTPIRIVCHKPHMSGFVPDLASANELKMLDNLTVDALIIEGPKNFPEVDGYRCSLLFQEPFLLFAHCDNPLAHASGLRLKDLENETLAVSMTLPYFYQRIVEACHESGFKPRTRTLIYDDFADYLRSMTKHDLCVISKSGSRIIPPFSISSLVALDMRDEHCVAPVYLVRRNDEDPALDALERILAEKEFEQTV